LRASVGSPVRSNGRQHLVGVGQILEHDVSSGGPEFVDAVARKSVELTVGRVRESSAVIAELERSGAIKIVGCFYNLSTGVVDFLS